MSHPHRVPIPNQLLENEYAQTGLRLIAGLDEVGRGAWAGPLVFGAVILPPGQRILGLRDSKAISRAKREQLARRIKKVALSWGIGSVAIDELNHWGLARSLAIAASRAIAGLVPPPEIILVDGKHPFRGLAIPQHPIVRGDQLIRSIAAASVIAKVERDRMMRTLHRSEAVLRPFRFDQNKGYPSPCHRARLAEFGPSPHHRLCFAPVRLALNRSLFG